MTQRQIAQPTHQSQSEVSEILKGRQVRDVWVLERIADGLGAPRAWMRLGYGEDKPKASSAEEVDEEMKRRALITAATGTVLGQLMPGLSESTAVALPTDQSLPSRLSMAHIHAVQTVTTELRSVTRYYGGQADLFTAAAQLYTRWMQVPAPETIKARLAAALAELHTAAGYCRYDSGLDGTGHFTRALGLADTAADTYGIANAVWHAGITMVNRHPNDALKLFQLGQIQLDGLAPGKSTPTTPRTDDPRIPNLTARLNRASAAAYALLDRPDQAKRYLTEAHDGWAPRNAFERAGADLGIAEIQLDLGKIDTAEQFAASAMRTYDDSHRRDRIQAELLLAQIHIQAGEPRGLTLAHHAIEEVSTLQSVATRRQGLLPLATALEARPSTNTQELAQRARKIAATRI